MRINADLIHLLLPYVIPKFAAAAELYPMAVLWPVGDRVTSHPQAGPRQGEAGWRSGAVFYSDVQSSAVMSKAEQHRGAYNSAVSMNYVVYTVLSKRGIKSSSYYRQPRNLFCQTFC